MDPYHNVVANVVDMSLTQYDLLAKQMLSLQKQMENIQISTKKTYSTQELCPYPFDKNLYMPPFPHNYFMPNFLQYRGKGNPIENIRDFHMALIEITSEQTYLIRLFPRSLSGEAPKWFFCLPLGMMAWDDLADKFIIHFSYKIEIDITIATLWHTKQEEGDSFIIFFQR